MRSGAPAFVVERLDLSAIVERLLDEDALALPLLTPEYRDWLLVEAFSARFRDARPTIGSGDRVVHQRMEVHDAFPTHSRFRTFARDFQDLWDRSLAGVAAGTFESKVVFNDPMLQRYAPGALGITPHRDRTAYRHVICLFVLAGRGRFAVCADRAGAGEREIPHRPGDLVITRAPGLRGTSRRPFHLVRDVTETRYVFGLRHERANESTPARV